MKQILIVDDSRTIRSLAEDTLTKSGYGVVVANDGKEGLEKAQKTKFDLIITDQNMPRMDGLTLTKSLRETLQYKQTPILILTTESGDDMKAKGKLAGASGWMVKPFRPEMMLQAIKSVLS